MKLLLVLALCIIESQAGGYDRRLVKGGGWGGNGVGWGHGYVHKTYGQTFDVKSDFYNDQSNAFDQKHVPAMHVPKVFTLEKSGYAPVVYSNNANGYAPAVYTNIANGYGGKYDHGYDHGYTRKTYGQTFDVKSDFYNDQSNAFDQKHVPAMHVPKVFTLEKSGYAPVVYSNNANGYAPAVYTNIANGYGGKYDHGYDHGYTRKTYGQTFDVKSDFYNDQSNAFDQKHVPAMHVPKVFTLEKSGYAPLVYSNNANGYDGYYANTGDGYASSVYKGNKYAVYDYEGDYTPNVVSANSENYGYVSVGTPVNHHGYAHYAGHGHEY